MEVRRRGDGHPPVTERERVIRLNGIGGVTFKTRIENSIRVFSLKRQQHVIPSKVEEPLNEYVGSAKDGRTEMFESLASCFAFRCSGSLDITRDLASASGFLPI